MYTHTKYRIRLTLISFLLQTLSDPFAATLLMNLSLANTGFYFQSNRLEDLSLSEIILDPDGNITYYWLVSSYVHCSVLQFISSHPLPTPYSPATRPLKFDPWLNQFVLKQRLRSITVVRICIKALRNSRVSLFHYLCVDASTLNVSPKRCSSSSAFTFKRLFDFVNILSYLLCCQAHMSLYSLRFFSSFFPSRFQPCICFRLQFVQ